MSRRRDLEKAADEAYDRVVNNPRDRNHRIIFGNRFDELNSSTALSSPNSSGDMERVLENAEKIAEQRANDFEEAMDHALKDRIKGRVEDGLRALNKFS